MSKLRNKDKQRKTQSNEQKNNKNERIEPLGKLNQSTKNSNKWTDLGMSPQDAGVPVDSPYCLERGKSSSGQPRDYPKWTRGILLDPLRGHETTEVRGTNGDSGRAGHWLLRPS